MSRVKASKRKHLPSGSAESRFWRDLGLEFEACDREHGHISARMVDVNWVMTGTESAIEEFSRLAIKGMRRLGSTESEADCVQQWLSRLREQRMAAGRTN